MDEYKTRDGIWTFKVRSVLTLSRTSIPVVPGGLSSGLDSPTVEAAGRVS